jgi:uncharacterized protein (DUF983 family)
MNSPAGGAPLLTALLGRCPRCGRGPLYSGLLRFRPRCPDCGLDLAAYDTGDGAAVAGIFVVGAVAVIAAVVVDLKYEPPLWLHALLWPIPVTLLAIWVMRVAKAALAAAQFRHRQGESES